MWAIFDPRNKRVLRLVRHKPDLCIAIGHGEGIPYVTPKRENAQRLLKESNVWDGDIYYMLEVDLLDIDRETRINKFKIIEVGLKNNTKS